MILSWNSARRAGKNGCVLIRHDQLADVVIQLHQFEDPDAAMVPAAKAVVTSGAAESRHVFARRAEAVTVRLPEEGWENELAELERLIVDFGVLERDIEMIDLRYPDNYIFRLHNDDSRPVSRERPA